MTAFSIPATTAGTRILGMGSYQPETVVSNHDLAKVMDTNANNVAALIHTGIRALRERMKD